MQHPDKKRAIVILAALLLIALSAAAQSEEKFKIRISPVPLDGAMRSGVVAIGNTRNGQITGFPLSRRRCPRLHFGSGQTPALRRQPSLESGVPRARVLPAGLPRTAALR